MAEHERAFWETSSVDEHLDLMRRQVRRSLEEGEIRRITQKVMKGHADDLAWTLKGRIPVIRSWGKDLSMKHVEAPAPGAGPACRVIPIWNFVCANVAYEKDPPQYDLFQTAEVTLTRGAGDCDDSCIVLCAMLHAAKLARPFARVISVDGETWSHVYAVAKFSNGELPLDPTVHGAVPGWEYRGAKRVRDFAM